MNSYLLRIFTGYYLNDHKKRDEVLLSYGRFLYFRVHFQNKRIAVKVYHAFLPQCREFPGHRGTVRTKKLRHIRPTQAEFDILRFLLLRLQRKLRQNLLPEGTAGSHLNLLHQLDVFLTD